MVHMISNYNLGYRMAMKETDTTKSIYDNYERFYIENNNIRFLSDNASICINDRLTNYFNDLPEGTIISFSEKGLCHILYSCYQGDTIFYMGGNCNSNCIMCPALDEERKLNFSNQPDETLKLIKMMPDALDYFVITGGEPTLNYQKFIEVVSAVSSKFTNPSGVVLTNGRSFSSEQLADSFVEVAPRNTIVAIPIHGSTSELHDYITQSKGSLVQSLKGINNLLKRKQLVEIRIVVTKVNCDDLLNIAKLIVRLFPKTYRVHFISLEVRGNCVMNKDLVYITPEDSFQKSKSAIDYLLKNGINVGLYNYPLCIVDKKYWFIYKRSISSDKATYCDDCTNCMLKEKCGGLFVSTLKTSHPKVYPLNSIGDRYEQSL